MKYANEYRTSQGLTTMLTHQAHLSYAARDWSKQQSVAGGLSHAGFPADRLAVLKDRFPTLVVKYTGMGENVLYTSSSSTDADSIGKAMVDLWIGSPGHRANIVGNYNLLGAGVYKSGNRWYATQIFMKGSIE